MNFKSDDDKMNLKIANELLKFKKVRLIEETEPFSSKMAMCADRELKTVRANSSAKSGEAAFAVFDGLFISSFTLAMFSL